MSSSFTMKAMHIMFALLLAGASASALEPETWYAERIASGDVPFHVEHFWSKGDKLRAETVIAGIPVVTLVNDDRYLIIDTLSEKGVSIQRSEVAIAMDQKRERPFGNEALSMINGGGEKVGTEPYGRGECDLYRVTREEGRSEVCSTTEDPILPLRVTTWRRESNKKVTIRYINWTRSLALKDSYFIPDPRFDITEISYDEYMRREGEEALTLFKPFFHDLLHGDGGGN